MKKKHICFVTKYYGSTKNGPGTFADNYIKSVMKSNKYNLTVISGELTESRYGENIYNYTAADNNFIGGIKIRKLINYINKNEKIDVVYFNCYKNAIASTSLNIPYFTNVNDFSNFIGKRKFVWKYLSNRVFKNAKMVFVNSEYTKEHIPQKKSYISDKFKVTGKGINLDNFKFKFNEINNHINILFVGSNYVLKGLEDLIRGVHVLKSRVDFTIHVNIVGDPMTNIDKYQNLIKEFGLDTNILFCGVKSKEEIVEYHNNSHFFVLPSHKEAFGVSILESLASGTPVIATNAGGIPSIIEDGVSGLLIEVGDFNSIANHMVNLINDDKLRYDIAINGLERVKRFDFKEIYNDIMSDINSII
ncbi:glycosyltransferase family 4 protein [Oceanobacillus caeni]|uniref:glycosyltransferase family 4 protein n=1 Tax=Oceanobacillus caeni TaxID=405946 RepID=UPI0036305B2E